MFLISRNVCYRNLKSHKFCSNQLGRSYQSTNYKTKVDETFSRLCDFLRMREEDRETERDMAIISRRKKTSRCEILSVEVKWLN